MNERVANLLGATALNVADLTLAEVTDASGASGSGSAALAILAEAQDLSVTDLGRRIGLSQPAAARMVDSLEERGLVSRRSGTGRAVAIRLTAKGRRTATRLLTRRGTVLEDLVADLDSDEQESLTGLLEKILRGVHARVGHATTTTPTEHVAELVCRLCDRGACRHGGAPCPVSVAQHGVDPPDTP